MAKKQFHPGKTFVAPSEPDSQKLVNELTVSDARWMILHDGKDRTTFELGLELVSLLVTSVLVAYAIYRYNATPVHLLLPLLMQYAALNCGLPFWQLVYRLPKLNPFVRNAMMNVVAWPILVGIVTFVRARQQEVPWSSQLQTDLQWVYHWIVSHEMHWPMISAFVGIFLSLSAKFRIFRDHGPPFCSVSMGCAVRILIMLLFAFFAIPISLGKLESVPFLRDNAVWLLWATLFAADLLAFYLMIDVRRRLKAHEQSV